MKLKKYSIMILSITILLKVGSSNLFANVNLLNLTDVPAKSVAVIDMENGRLMYGKNENQRMAIASTTKIMTALIALEQTDIDSYFEVNPEVINIEGTSMGLVKGDKVNLRSLAVGMLLPSGNDAAEVVAVRVSGNKKDFLNLMNETAKSFGCNNTHFATTSGLDDDDHYSTASDMVKIARHALLNSEFSEICKQQHKTIEFGNPPYRRTLKNHNKLLKNYDYCIGVKTGFTDNAGRCLVSAAIKDDIKLIVATLNGNDICESHINIYEQAFNNIFKYTPDVKLPVNDIKVAGGEVMNVPIERQFNTRISLIKGEQSKLKHRINLKKFIFAPVKKGFVVGSIDYYIDNEKIATEPIVTTMDVNVEQKSSFWDVLFKNINNKIKKRTFKIKNEQKNQNTKSVVRKWNNE